MAQEGHTAGVEHPRASMEDALFGLEFEFGGSLSIHLQHGGGHQGLNTCKDMSHGERPQSVRHKVEQQVTLRSIPATQRQKGADAEGLLRDDYLSQ